MAKVLGEPARYVTAQFTKKLQAILVSIMIFLSCMAFTFGYLLSMQTKVYSLLLFVAFLGALWIANKYLEKHIEKLETDRINFRKGAVGEAVVGLYFRKFPRRFQDRS